MKPDEVVEVWFASLTNQFDERGIETKYLKSPRDQLTCSFSFNLCKGNVEANLSVWDNGQGDLMLNEKGQGWTDEHFDDLEQLKDLIALLTRIADLYLSENDLPYITGPD